MKINFLTTVFLLLNALALPAQQWEWAIRPTYDSVVVHSNVAFVHDHGRWGVVDWEGHVLAEPQYDSVFLPPPLASEWPTFQTQPYEMKQPANLGPGQQKNALSYPERFPPQYTLEPLGQHAFKTPLVDHRTGELLYVHDTPLPLYYEGDNGRSVRLLNAFGQVVYQAPLASVAAFTNELLLVRQTPDGPFGLLNARSGALVSGFVYDSVVVNTPSTFYLYQRGGKWGLLSPDGREVEPPKFDYAHPYVYFVWLKNRDYGLLQNRRNEGFYFDGPCHDLVLQPNERGAWVLQNGRWGLVKFWWKDR